MQRVHFCSGAVFETGDAIAASVLRYAHAVGTMRTQAVLVIPSRTAPEQLGQVTLLINATSQLSAQSITAAGPELVDDDFVQRLDATTAALLAPFTWEEPDQVTVTEPF